jgi:hypothetical protein
MEEGLISDKRDRRIEMNNDESLDRLRQSAREELDRIPGADLLVSMPDGTKKRVIELTWDDLSYIDPELVVATVKCINRYALAKGGLLDMGLDGAKHIEELTLEDAPRLEEAIEDRRERFEGVIEAAGVRVGTIKYAEMHGPRLSPEQKVIDWCNPKPIEETRSYHQTEGN